MSILNQLSSQTRDRSEASNRKAALLCADDPALLDEIASGLRGGSAAVAGDCAEVMTEVARGHPELVAPYASELSAQIGHKNTRVRWEAVHALALAAALVPDVIEPIIAQIGRLVAEDQSVIVRDYAVDILSVHAAAGPQAALAVYPHLRAALTLWDGKHAGHAVPGLVQAAAFCPELKDEIRAALEPLLAHPKGVIREAARRALKKMA